MTRSDEPEPPDEAASSALQETRSAWLPSPEEFSRYEEILPGATERLMEMAKAQMAHRHALELQVVRQARRGQFIGLFISLSFLGAGVWLISTGNPIPGIALAVIDVAAIVSAFAIGRISQGRAQGQSQQEISSSAPTQVNLQSLSKEIEAQQRTLVSRLILHEREQRE